MDEIARVAPAFAGVSYDRLGEDGLQWPVANRDHPGTAILHQQQFPHGRAELARIDYLPSPSLAGRTEPLVLITGRALEHYNCGSMTRRSPTLALRPHETVEIHPDDASPRDIRDGDAVVVTSQQGEARGIATISDHVSPGTLFMTFHFPDSGTNNVTSAVLDRLADCPEYKVTAVDVRRLG
jgi:predicted molibdopterin-dependent oxidoreductase YjgC